MFVRHSLIALGLALSATACSPSDGPPLAPKTPVAQSPHFLRWAGDVAPQFNAIGSVAGGTIAASGGAFLAADAVELSLAQYTATFWAVRGEERSVQINYQSGGAAPQPFLRLTVVDPTSVPGLGDLAVGDSVLISVTVDAESIKVSLEPTGLVFGTPARLQMWYGGTGGDLNGDGVVDSTDTYIENLLLGMWYREGVADAWTRIPAVQAPADESVTSELQHFCEYAVSW